MQSAPVRRSGGSTVCEQLRGRRNEFIAGTTLAGLPAVLFDGEAADSARLWPYLASYMPVASDRVLLARVGHGFVVLGKITSA